MTVEVTSTYVRLPGNGVSTVFNFPFKIFEGGDLTVVDIDDSDPTAVPTSRTDFSVSISSTAEGGSITFDTAPLSAHTIDIRRNMPETQETDIRNQGRFAPQIHEDAFDKVTAEVQDLKRQVKQSLRYPDTVDADAVMTPLSGWAGKYVTINADGEFEAAALTASTLTQSGFNSFYAVAPQATFDAFLAATSKSIIGQLIYPQTAAEIAAVITPTNYAYEEGDLRRYNGTGDGVADDTTAIQSAISVAKQNGGTVFIPEGTWKYTSNINITSRLQIRGRSKWKSTLKKSGNIKGITIAANCSLADFTLDRTGTDTSVGIECTGNFRPDIRSVVITNQGSHGLLLTSCDLGLFSDIVSVSNGGDGVRIDATVSAEGNANTFLNIDARGNTGYGFNVVKGYSNFVMGLQTQNNTTGGLRLDDARGNCVSCYSEFNGGGVAATNVILTTLSVANQVFMVEHEGGLTDGSLNDANTIWLSNRGGTYDSIAKRLSTKKLKLPIDAYDGNQYTGTLEVTHTAADTFTANMISASGTDAIFKFVQPGGGGARARVLADVHQATSLIATGATITVGAGQLGIGTTTATTVGAAGAASVLPANPVGYLVVNIGGSNFKIPYYNN